MSVERKPLLPGLPSTGQIREMLGGHVGNARDTFTHHIERILGALADIREAVEALDADVYRTWKTASGVADGAGALTIRIQGPRPGFSWVIEHITTVIAGATTATPGVLYRSDVQPVLAMAALDDANFYVDDHPRDHFVPAGTPILFRLTPNGANANAQVSIAMQVKEEPAEQDAR